MSKVTAEFIIKNCKAKHMQQPCLKQEVYCAILTKDGQWFFGSNWISSKVTECPRMDMESGEGYEFCKNHCKQSFHAEKDAINNAQGADLKGAKLYMTGHSYVCENCLDKIKEVGIVEVTCLDNKQEYILGG